MPQARTLLIQVPWCLAHELGDVRVDEVAVCIFLGGQRARLASLLKLLLLLVI
jgi:hypothetical protein